MKCYYNFSLTLLLNFFCGNKWNHWVGFFPLVYFMCPIAKSLKFDAELSIVELHSKLALRLLIFKSNLLHVIVCFNLSYTHFVSDILVLLMPHFIYMRSCVRFFRVFWRVFSFENEIFLNFEIEFCFANCLLFEIIAY